jgi:hypothetical protein
LASELRKNGFTFAIYSESMPSVGFEGCFSAHNLYARKHNPIVNWQGRGLPRDRKQPGLLIGTDAAIVLAMITDAMKETI